MSIILNYQKQLVTLLVVYADTEVIFKSSPQEVSTRGKAVLKMSSKFTGEYLCRNVISIKLLCNFTFRHGCSVNLLHIFRTPIYKNTSEGLPLNSIKIKFQEQRLCLLMVTLTPKLKN